jgi:flagellar protein FlgJ
LNTLPNSAVYTDFNALAELKHQAGANSKEALEAVARQFESIFMQMMLKSMRDANLSEGIFENQQSDMFTDMYDKQIATSLSSGGNGIGLAEIMVRQLGEGLGAKTAQPSTEAELPALPERLPFRFEQRINTEQVKVEKNQAADFSMQKEPDLDTPEKFISQLMPHAERAANRLGVAPHVLLAQAALETGWGRGIIADQHGRSSHNLFNIKADHRWKGEQVAKQTLEYRDGVAKKELATFRSYDSFADSFDDYAEFLMGSSRYQEALDHAGDSAGFTRELQKAGYATDPEYANKINRIINDSDFDVQRWTKSAGAGMRESGNDVLSELKISGRGTLSNG